MRDLTRIDTNGPRCFPREKAEALAREMNARERDGWTYRVAYDPQDGPYAHIEAYDEAGFLAGKF